MSESSLLGPYVDRDAPSLSFTKADRDQTSERYPLDSVTVQGVTEDGRSFSRARIPLDDDGRVVISEETFGDDGEVAWLVTQLLDAEGWEYVER